MSTTQPLQSVVDVRLPIIQAPMAGVQGSELAAAVSNAGGLGSLPCALLSLDALAKEMVALTSKTSQPYNINFFCHPQPAPDPRREMEWRAALAPYYEELEIDAATIPSGPGRTPFSHEAADVIEGFRPPVVSFHFGLPARELLQRVRGWGAKVLSSATTVDEARWLEAQGVDGIIAQGLEAGGHRGMFLSADVNTQIGTLALVPQIARAVSIPVVAAGGVADAAGVVAIRLLGAAAAQVGTAYLLCPEATTSTIHRAALTSDAARITALTNVFTGRPARGIVNRIVRELGPMSERAPAFPLASAAIAPLRAEAERRGLSDFSPLWAGQNISGCREVSAGVLTSDLGEAFHDDRRA